MKYKNKASSIHNQNGISLHIKAKNLLGLENMLETILKETKEQLDKPYSAESKQSTREVYENG